MSRLLVVGQAAFDRLHYRDRAVDCAGGAGMYTSLAAHRAGAQVSMWGLRPDPCPEELKPLADRLAEWQGPPVPPSRLPRFHISYLDDRTEYSGESRGAEPQLVSSMLSYDLSGYALIHVSPQCNLARQQSFVQACRERGAMRISAGIDLNQTLGNPQSVYELLQQCDYFFMNEREARAVFGSVDAARVEAGRILFVTQAAEGALIIQGEHVTVVPATAARVVDPTGAGDTFCGATLAYAVRGDHPVMAARQAVALSAEMIGYQGATALLFAEPPPAAPLDPRVRVDDEQIDRVGRVLSSLEAARPYAFEGPGLPPTGHANALDFFFVATLQQFSFWTRRDNRYHKPLIATIEGAKLKGSDYLWTAYMRRLEPDAGFFSPQRQATLTRDEMLELFRSDDGKDPMPALDLHLEQARAYGRDMLALGLSPRTVLERAVGSDRPLLTFLESLDKVGGYKEDPLRKKSQLLAMILHNRPERFLSLGDQEQFAPIIDYHLMRSCLRVGLIDLLDGELEAKLVRREVLLPAEEWAVRYAAYLAMDALVQSSGQSPSVVDMFFFTNARRLCPEMTEPDCPSCLLDSVCAHQRKLFQPVLRTTFY